MRDSLAVGDVALESAVGPETPADSCIKTTYRTALQKLGETLIHSNQASQRRSRKPMRTRLSFSVVAITLSLVVACVDHRPGSVDVVKDQSKDQSGGSNQLPSAERDRLADDMSPSQIAEAQKLAREWNVRMSARQS